MYVVASVNAKLDSKIFILYVFWRDGPMIAQDYDAYYNYEVDTLYKNTVRVSCPSPIYPEPPL